MQLTLMQSVPGTVRDRPDRRAMKTWPKPPWPISRSIR